MHRFILSFGFATGLAVVAMAASSVHAADDPLPACTASATKILLTRDAPDQKFEGRSDYELTRGTVGSVVTVDVSSPEQGGTEDSLTRSNTRGKFGKQGLSEPTFSLVDGIQATICLH